MASQAREGQLYCSAQISIRACGNSMGTSGDFWREIPASTKHQVIC